MDTSELTRFLNYCDLPLMHIKDILVHENKPQEKWGLLCCLFVNSIKNHCRSYDVVLKVRKALLDKNLPATADDGGVDFWIAIILINNMRESSTIDQIAEELRDCGFDFMSACKALSRFFENITIYPPNVLLITKNEGELTNVICWP
ncbi:MAG: hypothetical protein AAB847_02715 [Patescibacteria group bacterium]